MLCSGAHAYVDVGMDLTQLKNYLVVCRVGPFTLATAKAIMAAQVERRRSKVVNGVVYAGATGAFDVKLVPNLSPYVPPTSMVVPRSCLSAHLDLEKVSPFPV